MLAFYNEGGHENKKPLPRAASLALIPVALFIAAAAAQGPDPAEGLDTRVRRFLDERRGTWRDMNVPEPTGAPSTTSWPRTATRGASRSAPPPGGRGLDRLGDGEDRREAHHESSIDEGRHREAVANFKAAGVASWNRRAAGRRARPGAEARRAVRLRVHRRRQGLVHQLSEGGPPEAHRGRQPHGAQRLPTRPLARPGIMGDFYEFMMGLTKMESSFREGVFVTSEGEVGWRPSALSSMSSPGEAA